MMIKIPYAFMNLPVRFSKRKDTATIQSPGNINTLHAANDPKSSIATVMLGVKIDKISTTIFHNVVITTLRLYSP